MNDHYHPLTPADLEAFEVEPLEFAIEEIAPFGALGLLHGREKSGKGLVSIDALVSVAIGETFLDRGVTPCPTIYCFGEENIREVRDRLFDRLGHNRDAPCLVLPLNGQTEDRFSLVDPESLQKLSNMIDQTGARFVSLDTMREFHNFAEDSSDEMAPLVKPIRQMAHEKNVAIWLNHHQNKNGTSRGSTAILASVDYGVSLTRTDTSEQTPAMDPSPRGFIKVEGRFGPPVLVNIELGKDMRWQILHGSLLPLDDSQRARILQLMQSSGESLSAPQIAEKTSGTLKTTQNLIAAMLKESSPPIVAKGSGRKGDPRKFMTIAPELIPGSRNDGNQTGIKMVPENDSRREGTGVGNKGAGNHSWYGLECSVHGVCEKPCANLIPGQPCDLSKRTKAA